MALNDMRRGFAGRAAAVGLGAAAALAPMSAGHAQDANSTRTSFVVAANADNATLTAEQVDRVGVVGRAYDYAMAHPGHVGVAVLRGADARDRGLSEGNLASGFERGIEGRYSIETSTFAGDNGDRPTAVTFFFQTNYNRAEPVVQGRGPFNMEQALAAIPDLASSVRATRVFSSLDYDGQD